jgi:DNA-binding transcriptional LysR family regulator
VDISKIDLNLLKVLDALLREQHVSRAARALHLSQPATSAALARLREALGDPVLVRSTRGMQPTERAVELAPRVRAMLQSIEQLLAAPTQFDPQVSEVVFNVAATDYAIELINAPLAQRLQDQAPQVRFAWRPVHLEGMVPRLERGEIDLVISNRARLPDTLRSRALLTETFTGIARKQHPALRKVPLSLDAFCQLPHVLVSPAGTDVFHGTMDDALHSRGLSRRVAFSVPQFRFAVDIVQDTDMVAVFPARLAALYSHRVRRFELPLAPPAFEIVAAWHERSHRSAPHQWLRAVVQECVLAKQKNA